MGEVASGQIAVLGLGNWGTALANHLASKGNQVVGWSIDANTVAKINLEHRNPLYQSSVTLSPNLRATEDLGEVVKADYVVVAVPSSALDLLLPDLKLKSGALVVSGIKGLERDSLLTPLQFFEQRFGSSISLAVLSGPSFAADLVAKRPVGVVAASKDEKVARAVAELFASEWMRVYVSTDPIGVEIGGVHKNVIALAAGVCDGLGLGDSARAGLITRGLAEMIRLAEALGGERQTLAGLSGLGDLAMTASSPTSRNRTVGFRLGQGESLPQILSTLGSVAEGVTTTPLMLALGAKHKVELPITECVGEVLSGVATPQEMVKRLILRPIKREF